MATQKIGEVKVTPVRLAPEESPKLAPRPEPRRPRPPKVISAPVPRSKAAEVTPPPTRPAAVKAPVIAPPAYPRAAATVNRPRPRPQPSVPRATPVRTGPLFTAADRVSPSPAPSSPTPAPTPTPTPSEAGPPANQPPVQTGEGDNEKGSVVPARPIGRIRPSTPAWDALKSGTIEAQFEVAADGKTVVTLLQKTGNEEADRQVLEYLQTIKWLPKTVHGVPTSDVRTGTFQREG